MGIAEKRLRIGMERTGVELFGGGDLHDAAQIHDRNTIRNIFDHAQVVRDEKVGEGKLALKVAEKIDDLRLDRDVER